MPTRQVIWRRKRQLAGLCIVCGKPRQHYAVRCDEHQEAMRLLQRQNYHQHKLRRPERLLRPVCPQCQKRRVDPRYAVCWPCHCTEMCKHCREHKPQPWKRGLCWSCYTKPEVRMLYPSGSPFGNRSRFADEDDDTPDPELTPCEPTPHLPGTKEKVQVLVDRLANGQELWHADDGPPFVEPL